MPLVLRLHTESSIPLEVDSLRLETMRTQSAAEIERTLLFRGNQQLPCGEFFHVSGSAGDDNTVIWQGDCRKVKLIGTHLTSGTVRVEGNAGMHLGAEMKGGEIIVNGNVGDWLGAEMHGGRIRVHGNAGHLVGAVYRGGRKGMTNGEILIDGDAGNEIGHTMRRGLIAIGGRTGDAAGVGMIAGSILVFGEPGIRNGAGMKRGTIALMSPEHPAEILPTFRPTGTSDPLFLRLLLRHLKDLRFPVPESCLSARYQTYRGDLLELGLGEILVNAV